MQYKSIPIKSPPLLRIKIKFNNVFSIKIFVIFEFKNRNLWTFIAGFMVLKNWSEKTFHQLIFFYMHIGFHRLDAGHHLSELFLLVIVAYECGRWSFHGLGILIFGFGHSFGHRLENRWCFGRIFLGRLGTRLQQEEELEKEKTDE